MFYGSRAEAYVAGIPQDVVARYASTWSHLIPHTIDDYFNRWVFAIMSVRARWQENVKGFLAYAGLPKPFDREQLARAVMSVNLGLYERRIAGVWELYVQYREHPGRYRIMPGETMIEARDRLAAQVNGLGLAKTAFVFEMIYPLTCQVVCVDTHMLQLYGYGVGHKDKRPGPREYKELEQHWTTICHNHGVPSPLARHIYWDRLQQQPDSLYWAWCLRAATPTSKGHT